MTSPLSYQNPQQAKSLLKRDQALIPQPYKKSLQSKALLNHYQQATMRKMQSQRQQFNSKMQQMQFARMQSERHQRQMLRRNEIKQIKKNEYSREYDDMIQTKKLKERYEKQREKDFENKILYEENWLPDISYQKEQQKIKKFQYGKQLEKHLKLQQQRRISEANRIKQIRQKMKRQTDDVARKQKQQQELSLRYKRNSMFQRRNNQVQGVRDALNWSYTNDRLNQIDQHQRSSQPISPRMDLMLKVQNQKYYEKGAEVQYKSEKEKQYFQKQNPELLLTKKQQQIPYNPITNPIPYKYKNPNILKLLSNYS